MIDDDIEQYGEFIFVPMEEIEELKPLDTIALNEFDDLEVDEFKPYGTEPLYFAIVGKDLYHKSGEQHFYRLLKSNYLEAI